MDEEKEAKVLQHSHPVTRDITSGNTVSTIKLDVENSLIEVVDTIAEQDQWQALGLALKLDPSVPLLIAIAYNSHHFHTECTRDHLLDIALLDFDWRQVGRCLLESEQNTTDIGCVQPDEPNRRETVLMMWQSQKGSSATYIVLATIFEKLGYGNIAEKMKEMEGKK
ncbi:hypothetical protein EMCRGX_G020631 [Ephydatia muelleri]|eukprot:Em0016g585a